jgi:hypothetical protein
MDSTEREIAEKGLRQSQERDKAIDRHRKAELAISVVCDSRSPDSVRGLAEAFLIEYLTPDRGTLIK